MKVHIHGIDDPTRTLCGRCVKGSRMAGEPYSWDDPNMCAACDRVAQADDVRAAREKVREENANRAYTERRTVRR